MSETVLDSNARGEHQITRWDRAWCAFLAVAALLGVLVCSTMFSSGLNSGAVLQLLAVGALPAAFMGYRFAHWMLGAAVQAAATAFCIGGAIAATILVVFGTLLLIDGSPWIAVFLFLTTVGAALFILPFTAALGLLTWISGRIIHAPIPGRPHRQSSEAAR